GENEEQCKREEQGFLYHGFYSFGLVLTAFAISRASAGRDWKYFVAPLRASVTEPRQTNRPARTFSRHR
ncbi:MAG: hypothetical protein DYG86_14060, partial [Chloroflexi bacterium CFX2]|nr:hypothetical protein [Chloroflexi bacterium CFX2]